jgi:acyl-CoA reductase-like NAD-dependent aldehyde dehydrogenase
VSPTNSRVDVRKTYKLYIGGQFPRSESGHSYVVDDATGRFVANAALASRKDARDAVLAARSAFGGWSGKTAYNRAQILYRVAEIMEDRRPQFVEALRQSEGLTPTQAGKVLDLSIDRLVWYAGWADKITQVTGNANPVAGPFFNLSTPEPTGVVAVVAPQESSLLGLVSVLAPVVVTGSTVVLLASERSPLPAVTLAEVLATSDVPGGVVNVLTGRVAEVAPWLAAHLDVNALDLTGVDNASDGGAQAAALEAAAAQNLKRVRRPEPGPVDWAADPGIQRLRWTLETKTVWHPVGV